MPSPRRLDLRKWHAESAGNAEDEPDRNGRAGLQRAGHDDLSETLRSLRRMESDQSPIILSAADPLNLVGIVSPGARLSLYSNQAIAYRGGVAVEVGLVGELISRLQLRSSQEG